MVFNFTNLPFVPLYLYKLYAMETILLKSDSKEAMNQMKKLAKKMGIEVSVLSEEMAEEISMVYAIKNGRTGKLVDPVKLLNNLKS